MGKPPPRDKYIGIDTDIRFHEVEDGDKKEDVEEAEILITHDKSLAASKKKLIKRNLPYIDMFDYEGTVVVINMRDLTGGLFEHLDINSAV